MQNKGVLPQVLHRSHLAGQNSSIKNMIFGDQGATTAEHALFLEYRYVLLLFTCKLGCCIDAPEVKEINYKLGLQCV